MQQISPFKLPFPCMFPVKMDDLFIVFGEIQRHTHSASYAQRLVSFVLNDCRAGNDILFFKYAVEKRYINFLV